eukprot:1737074-Pyramimonas_sp.AAC.1
MAVHKAKTVSTKSRRRIRFDTHNVEYVPYILRGKTTLDKWIGKPNGRRRQGMRSATALVAETERRGPTTLSTGGRIMV